MKQKSFIISMVCNPIISTTDQEIPFILPGQTVCKKVQIRKNLVVSVNEPRRTRSVYTVYRLKTQNMIDSKSNKKRKRMEKLKNMRASNPKYRKKILLPKRGNRVLVVDRIHLDLLLNGTKTLECRSKPCRILKIGDTMFFQETKKPGTVCGYAIFQGLVEFKSERHFRELEDSHRVYDSTLKESGYKYGRKFSSPHRYDEEIKVDSSGQQRKCIHGVLL